MRIDAIMPQRVQSGNFNRQKQISHNNSMTVSDSVDFSNKINNRGISIITFTGKDKNMNQVLSIAYENRGLGINEQYQGGMGVVTQEGPASMIANEGLDVRSIAPFHNHNNSKGGYKFLLIDKLTLENGKLPEEIEAKWFVSSDYGQTKEDLAKSLGKKPEDLRYVIQSEPNGKTADSKSKYILIEPTSAKGEFERMSDIKIGEAQKVDYQVFKVCADNPKYNLLKDTPNYFMYTKELAKTTKPYSYGPDGNGGFTSEIINSDMERAVSKALPQMGTDEFGKFNPASVWLHDRPAATFLNHIADLSAAGDDYYNGTISHFTMHNPGKNYQGHTDNPFEFLRVVATPEDIEILKSRSDYEMLENFNTRGWNNLTNVEKDFVHKAFEPTIGRFKDFFHNYNLTKLAIEAKKTNPYTTSIGTVSPNFDKEMKNPDMDVAPGLGDDLRQIETKSPLNGSTPANLGLSNNTQDFGRGNNTLSAKKSGFTPLVYDGDIEKYVKNREKNSAWFMNILEEAQKEGQDSLNKVFFNDLQIEQGRSVIGNISGFTPGKDLLVVGWGRPDDQKGFPISMKGYLEFLKREDVPTELKKRVFIQLGWGDAPYDKNSRDWNRIDKYYKEIIELEGGAYKNNLMLVDGRYPNKLVGCTTHGLFTSMREMCGITPLEAKSAGVPSSVTATGGPVDYINSSNGWKTKTAPEMNPPFDGLNWDSPEDEVFDTRVARSANEVSDSFKAMAEEYAYDKASYIAKNKKIFEEKFDWDNNQEFNGGKSANKMYREDIWQIDKGWDARNKNPLKRLVGSFVEKAKETKQNVEILLADFGGKVKAEIETASKAATEKAVQAIEETAKKAVTAIESATPTIKDTAAAIVTQATDTKNDTVKTASKTKLGKIIGFTAGTAAILGGAGYFAYTAKLFGKKEIPEITKTSPVVHPKTKPENTAAVATVPPSIQPQKQFLSRA